MENFSSFIITVCASCVLVGVLYTISPEGAISKSVKYILSLVFLITVIGAAGITVKDIDFDFTMSEPSKNTSAEMQISAAEYVFSKVLESYGINFSKITVCTDKSEDNSIVISKVIIYSDCEKTEILNALGNVSENYEVEIINE